MRANPQWASTDLRWRNKSSADDNQSQDDSRGFVEDYGSDRTSKGLVSRPMLCLWRWRNCSLSVPLLCAVAVAACGLSIQMVDSALVTAASSLTIFMAFLLILQRRRLRRFGTLRHQNNLLRRQAYFMRQERERLHRTLDRLDEKAADLYSVPHELRQIAKNTNVEHLIEIVNEQKELQEKIRIKINQQVMQQILTIVVREDRDKNWTLRPTEVEALVVRLGMVEGIEFDEHLFRQKLTDSPTVSTIMSILRSLVERDDEYERSEAIFKMVPASNG